MIIQSDFLTEGLFGQVFVWMLETLPYVRSEGWKPQWRIRTKNYGELPDFNVFPGVIQTAYTPETDGEQVSFEELQRRRKFNFRHGFRQASECWNSYFRFTDDVYERLDRFWQANFAGEVVLGVHYRGTDKNVDPWQTNPVSRYQFLCVVEDFLRSHPDVSAIFVASDDAHFVEAISRLSRVRFHEQPRSTDGRPTWNAHDSTQNQAAAKDAILDCLTLSRCRYALKCMSQLSAFSKVVNADLEIYRVSAFKLGWFPEAYIPLYRSRDRAVRSLLRVLQQDDFQAPVQAKVLGLHRKVARVVAQVRKKRAVIAARNNVVGR
jgi:hypothetical protein